MTVSIRSGSSPKKLVRAGTPALLTSSFDLRVPLEHRARPSPRPARGRRRRRPRTRRRAPPRARAAAPRAARGARRGSRARASARAIASPIPDEAPVTTATGCPRLRAPTRTIRCAVACRPRASGRRRGARAGPSAPGASSPRRGPRGYATARDPARAVEEADDCGPPRSTPQRRAAASCRARTAPRRGVTHVAAGPATPSARRACRRVFGSTLGPNVLTFFVSWKSEAESVSPRRPLDRRRVARQREERDAGVRVVGRGSEQERRGSRGRASAGRRRTAGRSTRATSSGRPAATRARDELRGRRRDVVQPPVEDVAARRAVGR